MLKQDYLKKYLDGSKEKKVKTKQKAKVSRMKIIDEDVIVPCEGVEVPIRRHTDEPPPEVEETPVVVLLDETRADELQMIGKFKVSNWKNLDAEPSSSGTTLSEKRERHDSDSSPPRHRVKTEPDSSPPRQRKRNDSDSSPPRKRNGSDSSPPRRRKQSDLDSSPPRQRKRLDSDSSPPRHRIKTEPDSSPPRQRRRNDSDTSPPRKRTDLDSSPPRRRIKIEQDSSPPRRRRRNDSDASPLRKRNNSDSPPRQRRKRNDSGSTPPKSATKRRESPAWRRKRNDSDSSPPRSSLKHKKSGSSSPVNKKRSLSVDKRRFEEELTEETMGRNAKAVVRKKFVPESKRKKELSEEEKKRISEMQEKYKVWNKGVKQIKEREERLEEMGRVASQPLARYEGDEDLEAHLKDQMLKDDPMFAYIHQKRVQEGKIVQSRPVYTGLPAPPNRYGILPGYRWDGCDRSNGFEKTLLSQKNLKKADEEEFYQWVSGNYE